MTTVTFADCVREAAGCAELVAQYDRLQGSNLSLRGSALDLEIDRATGRLDADLGGFVGFVWDCIYTRLPADVTGAA